MNENKLNPGIDFGRMSSEQMKAVRSWTNAQRKVVGQTQNTSAGTEVTMKIQFPQTTKTLLGFAFSPSYNSFGRFDLKVNNEVIIDNAEIATFVRNVQLTSFGPEYYEFLRILSGTDNIVFQIRDTASQVASVEVHYV